MTESSITYPGGYRIHQLSIYPAPDSENRFALDIRNLVPSFTIVESMSNDCIRGTLNVVDASGLLEGYPIRGEERLYIEFEDALGNILSYILFVYRVDNVSTSNNNDVISYTLHFTSYQRFYADLKRVTTFYDDLTSKIAERVFNTYYRRSISGPHSSAIDTNKQIIIEPTEGQLRCIIPYYTPLQAMKFLESRAYSSTSPSCSFRFFESATSFYFATDEYLYAKADDAGKVFEFSFTENIPQDSGTFERRMCNFVEFKNSLRVDTFDDLHGGTYKNKVLVLDITNRTTNAADPAFDYTSAKSGYFKGHQDNVGQSDRHSDSFLAATITDENARRFMIVKDYVDTGTGQLRGEQFIPEIISNRLSYFKNSNSIQVSAKSPGRLDITCGDFIKVLVPEFKHVDGEKQMNKQLSGIFMVESVTRTIKHDTFVNEYVLTKRNWAEIVDPIQDDYLHSGGAQ